MKIVGVRAAKAALSEYLDLAQTERVIVTHHGKPVALLVGLQGYDLADVVTASDTAFWKRIEARRKPPTVSSEADRHALGAPQRKGARRTRPKHRPEAGKAPRSRAE